METAIEPAPEHRRRSYTLEAYAVEVDDRGMLALEAMIRRFVQEEIEAGRWVVVSRKGRMQARPAEMADRKGGDPIGGRTEAARVRRGGISPEASGADPARARGADGTPDPGDPRDRP